MSKSEKVYSRKFGLIINILTVTVLPLIWWLFFDFTFTEISQEQARKLSQIGASINLLAALFLIIRFLWNGRYSRRRVQIEKLSIELERHTEFMMHQMFSEEQKKKLEHEISSEREKHENEMNNILSLDKVEQDHVYLGIFCLFCGTVMQIIGSGFVPS